VETHKDNISSILSIAQSRIKLRFISVLQHIHQLTQVRQ